MGGPGDGARVTPTTTIRYIGLKGRTYAAPREGLAAYRLTELGYVLTHACKGCGAAFDMEHRPDKCPLCGRFSRPPTPEEERRGRGKA